MTDADDTIIHRDSFGLAGYLDWIVISPLQAALGLAFMACELRGLRGFPTSDRIADAADELLDLAHEAMVSRGWARG
ncbi:MAG TPA: hypothetical protein VGL77_08445 [Armatimonadota bacterium]|jgi:hypothetical protein